MGYVHYGIRIWISQFELGIPHVLGATSEVSSVNNKYNKIKVVHIQNVVHVYEIKISNSS